MASTSYKMNRAISNGSIAKQVSKIFHEALKEPRFNWNLQFEYIASCLGLSIGLSTFWKFPFLIQTNGGVAFLFCYFLLLCLFGLPLYYLESGISQFAQLGCLHVWRCAPLMQGVGLAMIVLSLLASLYNGQIAAYVTHYFFSSFVNMETMVLWGTCKPEWEQCYDFYSNEICNGQNITIAQKISCFENLNSSSRLYWEETVLRITELTDPGKTGLIHWDLALSLVFVWFCVFLFLVKGTKSAGKVALMTGIAPICILVALLVVSVRQNGASQAIKHFYDPDWMKLLDIRVWQNALEQVIYSLGISYGCIFMLSSYNRFKNKVQYTSFILCIIQLIIGIMSATTAFAFYGAMANKLSLPVSYREKISQLEMLFTFYPEAIMRTLPSPHVWTVFYFLMLLFYGLHTQFVLVETCLTSIYDTMQSLRHRQFLVVLGIVFPLFLLSLPLCSSTGLYIHRLLEPAIIGPSILLIAFLEIISLNYLYGVRLISRNFKSMLGGQPSMYWKVMWILISPGLVLGIFVAACVDWEGLLYYNRPSTEDWGLYLSWALTLLPLAMIPLSFFYNFICKLCEKEPLFSPSPSWGPGVYDDQFCSTGDSTDVSSSTDVSQEARP